MMPFVDRGGHADVSMALRTRSPAATRTSQGSTLYRGRLASAIGRRCEALMMFGWLFMVIVVIAVVALLVRGVPTSGRAFGADGDQDGGERSALRILEERFASGEIDREEFERRREVLSRR
jgi:putative membrane protein